MFNFLGDTYGNHLETENEYVLGKPVALTVLGGPYGVATPQVENHSWN